MVPSDVLSNARVEFTHAFQDAIQGIVPAAIEALFLKAEVATSHEQKLIFHARALLQDKRGQLMQQLAQNMEQLLDRSLATAYNNFRPSSVLSQEVESLALLDPFVFENSLRFNEMTQHFRDKSEQQLRELNIRIAVLFGQDDMCERENPFRPYLLTRCISQSVDSLGLLPELNAILIPQLGDSLQYKVEDIYRATNACLETLGVSANLTLKIAKAPNTLSKSQSVVSGSPVLTPEVSAETSASPDVPFVPGSRAAPGQSASVTPHPQRWIEQLFQAVRRKSAVSSGSLASVAPSIPSPGMSAAWLSGSEAIGDLLRKVFGASTSAAVSFAETAAAGNTAFNLPSLPAVADSNNPPSSSPPELRTYHTVVSPSGGASAVESTPFPVIEIRLVKVVGRMHKQMTPDAAAMLNEQGDIRNLLREHRDALNSLAQTDDEKMTVDIVAMLFEFILHDALLDQNARIQIGRLQFLLLQQALLEPALLTEAEHITRVFLNRLATVAFAMSTLEPGAPLFEEELARLVKTLLRYDCETPELFSKLQERFETIVSRLLRHCDTNVKLAVKAVSEAEILKLRYMQTYQQLAHALSRLYVDPYLRHFLLHDWNCAIVRAERIDPRWARRYRLLVPDIFWSLSPKTSVEDRNQLSAMIPVMINNLHQGLELLGWDKTEQQMLLNWLADAHAEALRPGHVVQQPCSLFDMHEHFGQFTDQPEVVEEDNQADIPDSVPDFLPAVLSDSKLAITFLHRQPVHHDSINTIDVKQTLAATEVAFQIGTAWEVHVQGKPQHACMMWLNQDMSNLVLRFQESAAVMFVTYAEWQHLLQAGQARPLETTLMFDRAIRSLLMSADAIDHDNSDGK